MSATSPRLIGGHGMEIDDAVALARQLLAAHGLGDWRVVIDGAKTRAGVCRQSSREIGLSGPLTRLHAPKEVHDTILHEIAHALVGPLHKHDAVWRAQAERLGCRTLACLPPDAPRVAAPWVGTCPSGHTVSRHRRPERPASCRECSPTYDPALEFRWTLHGRDVPQPPAVATAVLPVGSTVRITAAGKYRGAVGTVLKRGRTRYHVRLRDGLVAVPFPLAERLLQ